MFLLLNLFVICLKYPPAYRIRVSLSLRCGPGSSAGLKCQGSPLDWWYNQNKVLTNFLYFLFLKQKAMDCLKFRPSNQAAAHERQRSHKEWKTLRTFKGNKKPVGAIRAGIRKTVLGCLYQIKQEASKRFPPSPAAGLQQRQAAFRSRGIHTTCHCITAGQACSTIFPLNWPGTVNAIPGRLSDYLCLFLSLFALTS